MIEVCLTLPYSPFRCNGLNGTSGSDQIGDILGPAGDQLVSLAANEREGELFVGGFDEALGALLAAGHLGYVGRADGDWCVHADEASDAVSLLLVEEDGHCSEKLLLKGAELDVGQLLAHDGDEGGDVAHGFRGAFGG